MDKLNKRNPVVVVGGGIGGLSAAITLAITGREVVILEKNEQLGGKMGQVELEGFRWDTGPSVITMRHVFDDLFQRADKRFADYVTMIPVEPLTRYFFPDGERIDASGNLSQMTAAIERLNAKDVEGYLDYLSYAARIHRITGPVFIYDRPPTPASFMRVPVKEWLKVDPFRTMHGAIKSHVTDPHLRQMLSRFATYVGGNPYVAPATLNVIAHVELTGGVWYPQGGIYRIAEAMTRLAAELGVKICTNIGVKQISMSNGAVTGVILENGQHIETQTVVANADVTTVYKHLLENMPPIQKKANTLAQYEPSCSGFIALLGVDGEYPQLAHHNIFFSEDYRREFETIFNQQLADDPTIYIAITSKADKNHAPDGCENWFILVNVPPLTGKIDWESQKAPYLALVLDKLAKNGLDVQNKVRVMHILTPHDLEAQTGAWRGALYGPSPNSKWTAFRRPHNRSQEVRGLYFAGGTTHPGGGVPMVTLSGKVAAELLLEDFPN